MKDGMPETYNNSLPSCPFSVHCEDLLEDLDKNSPSMDNDQDRQLLMQLQTHIPGCPTCTFILSHARIRRSLQRQQIHRFLSESEQKVPSTTAHIMQAIARERRNAPEEVVSGNGHSRLAEEVAQVSPTMPANGAVRPKRSTRRSLRLAQNLLAFVAVLAVILLSFNLFSHMLLLRQPSTSGMNNTPQIRGTTIPVTHSTTWSSVIIALIQGGQKKIIVTDAITGKSLVLASSPYATTIDGVSHDGYQVLYHVFDGRMTRYYLQSSPQNALLYTVNGKGGSALWSTDDSSVFISTPEGIEKVDMNAHTATSVLSTFKAPDLRFYRDGYLYFVGYANASALTGFNRMNLATGEVTPITAKYCLLAYDFWLSPGGTIVYYRCKANPTALYEVGSGGVGSKMLRIDAGRMIGYDAQGQPLTLLKVNTAFQVVKLSIDAQYDQTIIADIAPGASDVTVNNVAVAPYGFSLLALARYSNGGGKLWYDDLVHQKQFAISTLSDAQLVSSLQIGGWARLQIPASSHALGQ